MPNITKTYTILILMFFMLSACGGQDQGKKKSGEENVELTPLVSNEVNPLLFSESWVNPDHEKILEALKNKTLNEPMESFTFDFYESGEMRITLNCVYPKPNAMLGVSFSVKTKITEDALEVMEAGELVNDVCQYAISQGKFRYEIKDDTLVFLDPLPELPTNILKIKN